jgi:hypothetical protein
MLPTVKRGVIVAEPMPLWRLEYICGGLVLTLNIYAKASCSQFEMIIRPLLSGGPT